MDPQATISTVLVDVLRSFNILISRRELEAYAEQVPPKAWVDELGRLRVWAANIGAHQSGQSSLDYRLRDASHIKVETLRLLQRLRRTLNDVEDLLYEVATGEINACSSDDDDQEDEGAAAGTELRQIYKAVVDSIDGLYRLSMIIRRPAQHDRLVGTRKVDATVFEPFDRQHVANKFPRANSSVVIRLGAAISRRRAGLKYRARHHAKMAKGLKVTITTASEQASASNLDERHDAVSTLLSHTVATDFEEPHVDPEDDTSVAGSSQISSAVSLSEGNATITVPRIPKTAAYGKPFECPYCFYIVTVSNRRSWAGHVFKDLMPYTCVYADCPDPNRLYDSRREWFRHLQTKHRPSFDPNGEESCPLNCGAIVSVVSLARHLGQHLEELALFALPKVDVDDDEVDDTDSDGFLARAPEQRSASNTSCEDEDLQKAPREGSLQQLAIRGAKAPEQVGDEYSDDDEFTVDLADDYTYDNALPALPEKLQENPFVLGDRAKRRREHEKAGRQTVVDPGRSEDDQRRQETAAISEEFERLKRERGQPEWPGIDKAEKLQADLEYERLIEKRERAIAEREEGLDRVRRPSPRRETRYHRERDPGPRPPQRYNHVKVVHEPLRSQREILLHQQEPKDLNRHDEVERDLKPKLDVGRHQDNEPKNILAFGRDSDERPIFAKLDQQSHLERREREEQEFSKTRRRSRDRNPFTKFRFAEENTESEIDVEERTTRRS